MRGHSKTNGDQARALRREIRSLRRELDQAVALADRRLGSLVPRPSPRGREETPGVLTSLTPPSGSAQDFGFPPAVAPRGVPELPARRALSIAREDGSAQIFSVPGTPIVSGFLSDLGEYNPELMGRNAITTYEKMWRGDGQVAATIDALTLPILSAEWDVVPSDTGPHPPSLSPEERETEGAGGAGAASSAGAGRATAAKAKEVAAFVKQNLFGGLEFQTADGGWMSQPWTDVVRNAMLMVVFGCAIHEDVYHVDGERLRLRMLAGLEPLTFYRWHTDPHALDPAIPAGQFDDGRTLQAIEQYGYRGSQFLRAKIPASKICRFTYNQRGANFWGLPPTRAMYPHWYKKNQFYVIDAIAAERNTLGVPVVTLPPGFAKEDHTAAVNFVSQLAAHERTGMVLPASAKFEIVGTIGHTRDLGPSIQHHNEQISVRALAMFMNLGRTQTGSRALGGELNKFFMLSLQTLANQIALTIRNTTLRRLVAYNFGEGAPVPELKAANVQARALEDIIEALSKLGPVNWAVSDRPARNKLRTELGLPEEVLREDAPAPPGRGERGSRSPGSRASRDQDAASLAVCGQRSQNGDLIEC